MKFIILLFLFNFKICYSDTFNNNLISYQLPTAYHSGEIKKCFKDFRENQLMSLQFNESSLFDMLTIDKQKIIIRISGNERPYIKLKVQSSMPVEFILPDLKENWCDKDIQKKAIYHLKDSLTKNLSKKMLDFMDEVLTEIKVNSPKVTCSDHISSELIRKYFNEIKYNEILDYIIFPNGRELALNSLPNAIENSLRLRFWKLRNAGSTTHLIPNGIFKNDEGVFNSSLSSNGVKLRDTTGTLHVLPSSSKVKLGLNQCHYRFSRSKQGLKRTIFFNCEQSTIIGFRTIKAFECKYCSKEGKRLIKEEQSIEDKFISQTHYPKALTQFKKELKILHKKTEYLSMKLSGEKAFKQKTSDLYIKLWIIEDISKRLGITLTGSFYKTKMDLDKARKGMIQEIHLPRFSVYDKLIFN